MKEETRIKKQKKIKEDLKKDIELNMLRRKTQEQNWEFVIYWEQIHYIIDRITYKEIRSLIKDKSGIYTRVIDFR